MKRLSILYLSVGVVILGLLLFHAGCTPPAEDNNNTPDSPSNPVPEDGSTDVPIEQTLSWQCSDSDGDELTYIIYFGESQAPPRVGSNQHASSYYPGPLDKQKKYYWKIVALDKFDSTSSPVWSFTTIGNENQPPSIPADPVPSDGEQQVSLLVNLQWSCTDPESDPLTYDVYFGITNPPALIDTGTNFNNYLVNGLDPNTIYYWKIVANDGHSHFTEGPPTIDKPIV